MADIGNTLRETRMRKRIDIAEVESSTKIRAKYLRALENEEWDLLPGPTYVKSFLRTYAEALGLDPKLLVEEYKLRHERLDTGDLHPIRPPTARDRQRRSQPPRGFPRGTAVAVVLVLILVALFLIGQNGGDDDAGEVARTTPAETTEERPAKEREEEKPAAPRTVRLTVAPTAVVWVCLVNAGGDALIPGTEIAPGSTRTYRSRRFRVTLGNSGVRFRVDGRLFQPPQSAEPQGYEFSRDGRRTLAEDERPTCSGTT
jgi:cytoskeletal protein RodZ